MDSNYLSVADVALLLKRSIKWVYKHQAEIPGYFKLANSIFFDRHILTETLKTVALNHVKNTKSSHHARAVVDRHGLMN